MFQSFEHISQTGEGPPRLAALRDQMSARGLDAFIVPRADAYQGEYVAPCDARLAWMTGFTGSAGFCAVICEEAGVFVDGRYRVQVRAQVDANVYTPVDWPEVKLGAWLGERLTNGMKVGFDAWLDTAREVEELEKVLGPKGISLVACDNLVDAIWSERPAAPSGKVIDHPLEFAGESSADKRTRLAAELRRAGHTAAVLTLPDSISWLLNIRGSDIPRVPIVQAFAILHDNGRVSLFVDPAKFDGLDPGPETTITPIGEFEQALARLTGPVRVAKASAPYAVKLALDAAGVDLAWADDPCQLPKARKNAVELDGARAAQSRDAVAMVKFLAWLDEAGPGGTLTEIGVAEQLEAIRRESNALMNISFDTISASGPNAALPHYRVTDASNRPVVPGELLLVDSGGQYRDGTTDITRTIATGPAGDEEKAAFTRVLQGMIAISRARFPRGLAGRDLDALARYPLWLAGQDYDHGTGHGVGSYLSVHEGPQRISRLSEAPLEPSMILSNEPGYYREGQFGIRIENLIVVREARPIEGGDSREMLDFETLTFVPIDKRLILPEMLTFAEREWLDAYHAQVRDKNSPLVSGAVLKWLKQATQPL